jgi:hypothetical protein
VRALLAPIALVIVGSLAVTGCSSSKKPPKPKTGEDAPNMSCASSNACKVWGWCTQKDGECVASGQENCTSSEACRLGGLCTLVNGRCIAHDDGDCSGSEWCKKYGYCDAEDGVCKD